MEAEDLDARLEGESAPVSAPLASLQHWEVLGKIVKRNQLLEDEQGWTEQLGKMA